MAIAAVTALYLLATSGSVAADRDHFPNIVRQDGVRIPMRDGVELGATLIRPAPEGRYPAIVFRTPYGKDDYATWAEFPYKAARRGYAVFLVDVRGRYTSDGEFEAYRNEKRDGHDTVEWIADSPWCNGKVGSYGGSYPGYVQWLALSENPPHYTTAVPTMTPVDSHHFFYMGGGFNNTWFEWFMPYILPDLRRRAGDRSGPWDEEEAVEEWQEERAEEHWYHHRPLTGVPLLREHAPYYYEWLTHPDRTEWWDFADVQDYFHRIEAPVLNVSGWYDNNYGPVGATRGFRGMRREAGTPEARRHTKLLMGPWNHASLDVQKTATGELDFGPAAGIDFDAYLLRWFDRRLKGIDNGIDEEPPVRIFVMGENRWRYEEDWPPPEAKKVRLYLESDGSANLVGHGGLSLQAPGGQKGNETVGGGESDHSGADEAEVFDSPEAPNAVEAFGPSENSPPDRADADGYVFNPADPVWDPHFGTSGPFDQFFAERREDVLVYTSPPLQQDLEVTGPITAELWVSTDAPDTDFVFMLCDVHPDGTSYNLAGPEAGFLRMRYREGFDHQVPTEPGRVYRITLGHLNTSNVFEKGHRIRVQVSSSRAPHFDPNPNTGTEIATETELRRARQTIYHDAERPSHVVLSVIPRDGK